MAYEVKQTNGIVIATVQDGQVDSTTTSIGLIGRRYADYGLIYNENQMHLLENFSNSSPPQNPVVGQLWFDASPGVLLLKVYVSDVLGWSPLGFTETFSGATVTQDINFQGQTSFNDVATFESKSFFNNNVTFVNTDVAFQDSTLSGNPTVTGQIVFQDAATFQSTATFSGGFAFSGAATFDDTVVFNGPLSTNNGAPVTFGDTSTHNAATTHNAVVIMENDSYIQFAEVTSAPTPVIDTAQLYNASVRGNDANTILFCYFAGTEGATTITDSSAGTILNGGAEPNNTIVASGNAAIDTFTTRHGTGSLILDGTGDYVTVTDTTNWDFGTGEFTIDSWIRVASTAGTQTIFSKGSSATDRFELLINAGALEFLWNDGANSISISGGVIPTSEWVHVAVVGVTVTTNTRIDIYINGDRAATTTVVAATYDFDSIGGDFEIGRRAYGTFEYLTGNIDNMRAVTGAAKYTSGFTPRLSTDTGQTNLAYMTNLGITNYLEYDFGVW